MLKQLELLKTAKTAGIGTAGIGTAGIAKATGIGTAGTAVTTKMLESEPLELLEPLDSHKIGIGTAGIAIEKSWNHPC